MIDFRYHLVSLVSVFLALAVGIVLGAGPLQDSIGNALTEQVRHLRQEKDTLHDSLSTAETGQQNRDTFLTTLTPELVSGQLTGRSIVVIGLPGLDYDPKPLVQAIDNAGGTVTGQVSVKASWTAAQSEQTREKALAKIAAALPNAAEGNGDTVQRLDTLLAAALVGTGSGVIERNSSSARTVINALSSADLIDVKGDLAGLAGSAIVLAPAVTPSTGASPSPTPTSTEQPFVRLADTLDSAGGGAVVSGPASSATADGLVALIRKTKTTAAAVSTVDDGQTPAGVITAVLALHEQVAGGVGAYGFGQGASDPVPASAISGTSSGASS